VERTSSVSTPLADVSSSRGMQLFLKPNCQRCGCGAPGCGSLASDSASARPGSCLAGATGGGRLCEGKLQQMWLSCLL